MLTKLQVIFGILAAIGIIVFAVAIFSNAQVKTFEKVPEWVGQVVWGSFGVMVACCFGVVVTLGLEHRRKDVPEDEDEMSVVAPVATEEESPLDELEPGGSAAEAEPAAEELVEDFAPSEDFAMEEMSEMPPEFTEEET